MGGLWLYALVSLECRLQAGSKGSLHLNVSQLQAGGWCLGMEDHCEGDGSRHPEYDGCSEAKEVLYAR